MPHFVNLIRLYRLCLMIFFSCFISTKNKTILLFLRINAVIKLGHAGLCNAISCMQKKSGPNRFSLYLQEYYLIPLAFAETTIFVKSIWLKCFELYFLAVLLVATLSLLCSFFFFGSNSLAKRKIKSTFSRFKKRQQSNLDKTAVQI